MIESKSVKLSNGSDLESYINFATDALDMLKTASELTVQHADVKGALGTNSNYNELIINESTSRANQVNLVSGLTNGVIVSPMYATNILILSASVKTSTVDTNIYFKLQYRELGSSNEWNDWGSSIKCIPLHAASQQSVMTVWCIAPTTDYEYRVLATSNKSDATLDTSRQSKAICISYTNSQH